MSIEIKGVRTHKAFIISKAIEDNDGYCINKEEKTEDTKCICKQFKNTIKDVMDKQNNEVATCDCGLYTVEWK